MRERGRGPRSALAPDPHSFFLLPLYPSRENDAPLAQMHRLPLTRQAGAPARAGGGLGRRTGELDGGWGKDESALCGPAANAHAARGETRRERLGRVARPRGAPGGTAYPCLCHPTPRVMHPASAAARGGECCVLAPERTRAAAVRLGVARAGGKKNTTRARPTRPATPSRPSRAPRLDTTTPSTQQVRSPGARCPAQPRPRPRTAATRTPPRPARPAAARPRPRRPPAPPGRKPGARRWPGRPGPSSCWSCPPSRPR